MNKDVMPKLTFNPVISIDGVAIIIAFITGAIWCGKIGATVHDHGEMLKHIQAIQETQAQSLHVTDQALAVLTEIVNQRTSPPKKP